MMLQQNTEERSIGELFGQLASDLSTLVRQEVNLAKSEMSQKANEVGKDIGLIAVGGIFAFCALLALQDAAILALAEVLPPWGAALIVGLVVMVVAVAFIMKGLGALKKQDLAPRQTIDTLKEDAQWLKQQVK